MTKNTNCKAGLSWDCDVCPKIIEPDEKLKAKGLTCSYQKMAPLKQEG